MAETGYVGSHAIATPDKPAAIDGDSGAVLTYRELDRRSNQLAHWLHAQGLRRGDHLAVILENNLRYFEIVWAALRSGLVITPVNRYLTAEETAYIVSDCGARAVITSWAMRELAAGLDGRLPGAPLKLMLDGVIDGWAGYEEAIAAQPAGPLGEQWRGTLMLYSSGTTGRPKGILRGQPQDSVTSGLEPNRLNAMRLFRFSPDMVYLSTAPMYHAAPIGYTIATQYFGGTVVMMPRFDASRSLELIERYRVTHSQWVPTMFIRLLKLPAAERSAHDLSSHRVAIHAAAPCPVEVKRQIIDWWGPIVEEYYGASEGNGITYIDSRDWLARPGSVGRTATGPLHICDDYGRELPTGEVGSIYFENPQAPFQYHNDPEKTRGTVHPQRPDWTAVGDLGYLDAEGFLYLTDRKSFMIISGGVNIYPQAIEDALALHSKVADVAVIGVPSEEMGEDVKAVVQPAEGVAAGEALAQELIEFLHDKVARYMVPRSVDFVDELPRLPTGKLYKKALRDRYWAGVRSSDRQSLTQLGQSGAPLDGR